MTDKDFVLEALFDDIMKVAKVNIQTGEYIFIKQIDTVIEKKSLKAKKIDEYIRSVAEHGVIHPQDISEFYRHTDLNYIREQIQQGKKHFVHSYRRRFGDIYTWMTFVITVPKTYSEEHPWVIFRWEESDDDHHMLEDSLRILSTMFHKILKINLAADSYEIIKLYPDEMTKEQGFDKKLSIWFRQFAMCGNICEEDRQAFTDFTNLRFLRHHFKNSSEYLRCRYRRRTGGVFRWVSMELVPSIEYSDDNPVIMLYIRDIHDEYVSGLHYQKELEYYCNTDIMTGLWNRYYCKNYCVLHFTKENTARLGIIFADLNGLKRVNDLKGHAEGDEFIKNFAHMLAGTFGRVSCCRVSGDEFLVWQEDISEDEFRGKVKAFHETLQEQEKPVASIGAVWSEEVQDIAALVKQAETAMYQDKQKYYERFPEEHR